MTLSFKLAVVERVEIREMNYCQATERYVIEGNATVMNWLRKYGPLDWRTSPPPESARG